MAASVISEFDKLINSLKSRKYAPIYFLQGEETYFIDKIADYIENHVLNEGERGFNQTIYYGKDVDLLTVMMAARRFPMMSDYQVVMVKEAQNLKDLDKLLPYIENPVPSTVLAFTYKGKKLDKRTKAAKLLAAAPNVLFDADKLYESNVPGWVQSYLKSKGYGINERACALLVDSLGNDLGRIANEVDKMLLNLEGKGITIISDREIEENIGISKDYNVFELQDAIGRRNFKKAMEIITYFGASKGSNSSIIVMIPQLYSFFTKLYRIHYLKDKSKESVSQAVGINPYFFNDYITYFKNFTSIRLENIFRVLQEFDLKSKGMNDSGTADGELMKEMVVKIFS